MIATADLLFWAMEAISKTGSGEGPLPTEDAARKPAWPASLSSLLAAARQYAEKPETTLEDVERLQQGAKADEKVRSEHGSERKRTEIRLIQRYLADLHAGKVPGSKPSDRDWVGAAALRHWEKADALPHPLQRQARALVAATLHGGWSLGDQRGVFFRFSPSIHALLRGLESFLVEDAVGDDLVVGLYCRGLEAIAALEHRHEPQLPPPLLERITASLATALAERLNAVTLPKGQSAAAAIAPWLLEKVLRARREEAQRGHSLSRENMAGLDERIAPALLGLVAESEDEVLGPVVALFSAQTVNRMAGATVRLVHQFPDFFLEATEPFPQWLRTLLSDLFRPGKDGQLVEPDLLAETACQVLERGLEDLPLLARHPSSKQLYIVLALRSLLEVMVEPRPTGGLRPRPIFSRHETAALVGAVIGAWHAHPEWLLKRAGHQERAATLLPLLVHSLLEFDPAALKALLRAGRLQPLLSAVLTSSLSGKLSAFNAGKISGLINQIYPEVVALGIAGLDALLQQGRLTDLFNAIAASKVGDKVLGENEEALRQGARSIAAVAHDLRNDPLPALTELVERLNKGK